MRTKFLLPLGILILGACMMLITACRKDVIPDQPAPAPTPVENEETLNTFFNKYAPEDQFMTSIRQFVMSKNKQFHFAKKLSAAAGFPVWNKPLVYNRTGGNAQGRDSTVIFIPFARNNDLYVDAAMGIKIRNNDTSVKMIYSYQYKAFDRSAAAWKSRDVFDLFALLNNKVFGVTKFKMKDHSLVAPSILKQIPAGVSADDIDVIYTLAEKPADQQADYVITICNTYTYCLQYKLKAFRADAPECLETAPTLRVRAT